MVKVILTDNIPGVDEETVSDFNSCISSIEQLLDEFQLMCEDGSAYKNQAHEDQDASIDHTNITYERTLVVEDTRPTYVRSKTTYKKRKIHSKMLNVKDEELSFEADVEMGSKDLNQEMNWEDFDANNPHYTQEACRTIQNVYYQLRCMINHLWTSPVKKLTELSAFKLGIELETSPENLDGTWNSTISRYSNYFDLGRLIGKLLKNKQLLISFIPTLIKWCWGNHISLYKPLLKVTIEFYAVNWGSIAQIEENFAEDLRKDIAEIVLPMILTNYDISNDEEVEYLETIVEQCHQLYYEICLDITHKIIEFQVSSLLNPRNLLSNLNSLQKEHLVIIKQLTTFINISQIHKNEKNIKFIRQCINTCHPIKQINIILSLLYTLFTNNTKYHHHNGHLTSQESFIMNQLFKRCQNTHLLQKYLALTSRINQETSLSDISLLTNNNNNNNQTNTLKRSRITTGDLI